MGFGKKGFTSLMVCVSFAKMKRALDGSGLEDCSYPVMEEGENPVKFRHSHPDEKVDRMEEALLARLKAGEALTAQVLAEVKADVKQRVVEEIALTPFYRNDLTSVERKFFDGIFAKLSNESVFPFDESVEVRITKEGKRLSLGAACVPDEQFLHDNIIPEIYFGEGSVVAEAAELDIPTLILLDENLKGVNGLNGRKMVVAPANKKNFVTLDSSIDSEIKAVLCIPFGFGVITISIKRADIASVLSDKKMDGRISSIQEFAIGEMEKIQRQEIEDVWLGLDAEKPFNEHSILKGFLRCAMEHQYGAHRTSLHKVTRESKEENKVKMEMCWSREESFDNDDNKPAFLKERPFLEEAFKTGKAVKLSTLTGNRGYLVDYLKGAGGAAEIYGTESIMAVPVNKDYILVIDGYKKGAFDGLGGDHFDCNGMIVQELRKILEWIEGRKAVQLVENMIHDLLGRVAKPALDAQLARRRMNKVWKMVEEAKESKDLKYEEVVKLLEEALNFLDDSIGGISISKFILMSLFAVRNPDYRFVSMAISLNKSLSLFGFNINDNVEIEANDIPLAALLGNLIKSGYKHGRRLKNESDPFVDVVVDKDDDYAYIKIENRSPILSGSIFKRGETSDPTKGDGYGLDIAKKLARSMGAELYLDNREGDSYEYRVKDENGNFVTKTGTNWASFVVKVPLAKK